MTTRRPEKPPRHLTVRTRRWWAAVEATFDLEEHHRKLLTMAGEHWDRAAAAREAIAAHGLTFTDRYGAPRERPEIRIARDSTVLFARLVRELRLDGVGQPGEDERPPRIPERSA